MSAKDATVIDKGTYHRQCNSDRGSSHTHEGDDSSEFHRRLLFQWRGGREEEDKARGRNGGESGPYRREQQQAYIYRGNPLELYHTAPDPIRLSNNTLRSSGTPLSLFLLNIFHFPIRLMPCPLSQIHFFSSDRFVIRVQKNCREGVRMWIPCEANRAKRKYNCALPTRREFILFYLTRQAPVGNDATAHSTQSVPRKDDIPTRCKPHASLLFTHIFYLPVDTENHTPATIGIDQ